LFLSRLLVFGLFSENLQCAGLLLDEKKFPEPKPLFVDLFYFLELMETALTRRLEFLNYIIEKMVGLQLVIVNFQLNLFHIFSYF